MRNHENMAYTVPLFMGSQAALGNFLVDTSLGELVVATPSCQDCTSPIYNPDSSKTKSVVNG